MLPPLSKKKSAHSGIETKDPSVLGEVLNHSAIQATSALVVKLGKKNGNKCPDTNIVILIFPFERLKGTARCMAAFQVQGILQSCNLSLSGENTCLLRTRDSHCSPDGENMHQLIVNSLKPTPQTYDKARQYALKHFNTEDDYIAVMVRWELIFLNSLYFGGPHYTGAACVDKIRTQVEKWLKKERLNKVFLTTDAGKYGSSTLPLHRVLHSQDNHQAAINFTEQLFQTFNYTYTGTMHCGRI